MQQGGYCVPRGYMSESYEAVAFDMPIGARSDIVEDENGYYIIRRNTIDAGYVLMNFDTLSDRYRSYAFLDMIDQTQEQLQFVPNDYGKSLNALTLS